MAPSGKGSPWLSVRTGGASAAFGSASRVCFDAGCAGGTGALVFSPKPTAPAALDMSSNAARSNLHLPMTPTATPASARAATAGVGAYSTAWIVLPTRRRGYCPPVRPSARKAAGSSRPRRCKRRRSRPRPRSSRLFTAATVQPSASAASSRVCPCRQHKQQRQAQCDRQTIDLLVHDAEQLTAAHLIGDIAGVAAFRHEI